MNNFGTNSPKARPKSNKQRHVRQLGVLDVWTRHNSPRLTSVGFIYVTGSTDQDKSTKNAFESQKVILVSHSALLFSFKGIIR